MLKTINATVYIKPGKERSFLELAKELTIETRNESGNLLFELYQSNSCKSNFVFIEVYDNQEAIITHRDSDHFQTFLKKCEVIQNAPMDVMIFEGTGSSN